MRSIYIISPHSLTLYLIPPYPPIHYDRRDAKEIEREIRLALLAFLANKDTPLEHIWQEIVQPHLRENPPAINREESYVMNVPINELITRFKIACKMLGPQDKREKTYPPRISSSNTKPTKEITTNNQRKRCDKCITLNTPCSPNLPLCKESRHQKRQSIKDSSTKSFVQGTTAFTVWNRYKRT